MSESQLPIEGLPVQEPMTAQDLNQPVQPQINENKIRQDAADLVFGRLMTALIRDMQTQAGEIEVLRARLGNV